MLHFIPPEYLRPRGRFFEGAKLSLGSEACQSAKQAIPALTDAGSFSPLKE
jgi:hypothetical protein